MSRFHQRLRPGAVVAATALTIVSCACGVPPRAVPGATGSAQKQPDEYVTVHDTEGHPLAGVAIHVYDANGKVVIEGHTDGQGRWDPRSAITADVVRQHLNDDAAEYMVVADPPPGHTPVNDLDGVRGGQLVPKKCDDPRACVGIILGKDQHAYRAEDRDALPKLHSRFQSGDVAFIRGVDILNPTGFQPLSHFDKTDYVSMSYSAPPLIRSGAWGRWADIQPDNPLLMATVNYGLPILFTGVNKVQAAALPTDAGDALGAVPTSDDQALVDALVAIDGDYSASDPSLAAKLAHTGGFAMRTAGEIGPAYPPNPTSDLAGSLEIIAALINANVTGTRVYATVHGGYDTHENQIDDLDNGNFPELDDALDGFFTALTNAQDVVVMIWTEFGRRAASNNGGTDHGRPNNVVLAGPRVNGGLYGAQPSFADAALDDDGNLVGSVEFGSVYTDVITNFLGGDAATILGGSYPTLGAVS